MLPSAFVSDLCAPLRLCGAISGSADSNLLHRRDRPETQRIEYATRSAPVPTLAPLWPDSGPDSGLKRNDSDLDSAPDSDPDSDLAALAAGVRAGACGVQWSVVNVPIVP